MMRASFVVAAGIWGLTLAGCARDFHARLETAAPASATLNDATCMRVLGDARSDDDARRRATEALIERHAPALLASPQNAVGLPGGVSLRLRQGGGPGGVAPAGFMSLVPTDRYVVTGVPVVNHTKGVGAPLVGTRKPTDPVVRPGSVAAKPITELTWCVTAVAAFEPSAHVLNLDLYDARTTGRTAGGNGQASRPLAGDFTTPLAVVATRLRPERRGLGGLLHSNNYFASSGLFPTEKPTPEKIPLVFVHGLLSDPSDFRYLRAYLDANPEIRRRYQVWVFYYPSSLPVVYAAMMLRESLEKFVHDLDPAGTHPPLHQIVLVGHSMGGLLSRFAVSDGGDTLYRHFFRQPVDELHLTASERDLLERGFYYRACPDVAQVVFIATPHHGSGLASGLLGNIGRLLTRLPLTVRSRIAEIFQNNRGALANQRQLRPGSSLDSLSPHGPTIAALNDLRMRPGVRLHSIIGDRGRGGPPEGSSDGVVPYASSHLPEAESECIVPAGHTGTLKRPETAAEIVRILGVRDQG